MASASSIKAGEAFVRIFLDKGDLEKDIRTVQASLNKFARSAQQVGIALSAIGGSALFGLGQAVQAANEIELTGRRLNAVFRDGAEDARSFSKALAKEIGASRFEIEKTITTFKAFFAEIIENEDEQTQFAKRLAVLSRDFAAFQGLTSEDALQRFISALSGSPEVLDRFGINLKAAAINADLAARGIDGTTATVSEFQKVISRLRIIEDTLGSQGAIGKAREELNKFNGRLQQAKAAVLDFLVSVGKPLLTALRPVLIAFTSLVKALTRLTDAFPFLSVAVGAVAVAITGIGGALITLSLGLRAASVSLALLGKASVATGISIAAPITSIRALVQTSKILNESLLTTIGISTLGSKKFGVLSKVLQKIAPVITRIVSVLRFLVSASGLIVGLAVAVAVVIGLIIKRLLEISGAFEKISTQASIVGRNLKNAFFDQIDRIRNVIKAVNDFANSLPVVGKALEMLREGFFLWLRDLKEGFAEVKDFFGDIAGFLGFGESTELELTAKIEGAGQTLTPEEAAAEEERIAKRRQELAERIEDLRIAGIQNTTARAIAEIEKRYDREIKLAEGNAAIIFELNKAKDQELFNLRTSLVNQYYKRLASLDDQIARERAAGLENEFAKRRREAQISRDIALRAENITLSEREKINELFNQRIKNIEKDRVSAVADFDQSLAEAIQRFQIDNIESRLDRELASIDEKYKKEREEARRLGADLEQIDRFRDQRREQAIEEERRRQKEASADFAQSQFDANEDVARQIDRIDIELSGASDLQKALDRLELDRLEAIADFGGNAEGLEALNELFDKREQLLRQEAQNLNNAEPFGTFSALQISAGLGGGEPNSERELLERQLEEQRRGNRTLEEIRRGQGAGA